MLQSELEFLRFQTSYGEFIWPVRGFNALRKSGKLVKSSYFYSWKGGYKLNILLYPQGNGKGEGTHLSIFIQGSNQGEFDQILSKSIFKCKVEIALLSQQEDKENAVYSFNNPPIDEVRSGGLGYPTFIPLEELENSPYLKNDTIFIQVTCTKD